LPHVQDDGFHEIQLNGKQLVFLFMAATVVSVVIFLCGVLVGRGVRAERGAAESTSIASTADTMPQPAPAPPTQPPAGSDPTAAAAPPPVDDLSYFSRLEKSKAPAEQLKPTPGERASRPVPAEKGTAGPSPKAAPQPEPARAPAADAASEEPAGQGFAVQIAALNVRSEADAIAKRLSSKGYAAYVISPAHGTPTVYRVRVGKFTTRREAETVAAKLQKEEQFRPWVTR
jgi:cell division septation protein DedD